MTAEANISVDFAGLRLASPVMTASGTCGYADELAEFMDVGVLGGIVSKSITLRPRQGNPPPRVVETDAGILNAIGLANIGVDRFIAEKVPVIERLPVPVFVNLAGETIDDYVQAAQRLARAKAIAGIELNISCPNVKRGGITFGTDAKQVSEITRCVKAAAGKKILIVKLAPTVTDISVTAHAAVAAGADALSLVNTFTAMVIDVERRRPVLANATGGLSGPAIRPMAVYLVNKVYREVACDSRIPIIGMGGVRTGLDAIEFMMAGATAVAVGTGSFVEPDCAAKVVEGVKKYCARHKIRDINEIIGCACV